MPQNNDNRSIAGLPPQYTSVIACDARGLVRVGGLDGVCIGRIITEGDVAFFEAKDRNAGRSYERGAQLLRIDVLELIEALKKL